MTAQVARLHWSEILLAALLASTSGAALIAHLLGAITMPFSVPFIVLPSALLLSGLLLFRARLLGRLRDLADRVWAGAAWGLAATLAYDAIRPLLMALLGLTFNPYRAIPLFGTLMTGLPPTDPTALTLGWIYHFWNGISFGMMFALILPKGGVVLGILWAETLQLLMMLVYPSLFQARLDDPGFLVSGLVGHGFWGVVLGYGLKRWGPRA